MNQPAAILLLGPTGAGKTPLGNALAHVGFRGQRCLHFDFGAHLRHLAASKQAMPPWSLQDIEFVRQALDAGALLEDDRFPIAARIFALFCARHAIGPHDWVVLNGLPRHIGQARHVARILSIRVVLSLHCTAAVVRERIRINTGGDRTGRPDDDPATVRAKLRTFPARTRPLLAYYKQQAATIIDLPITPATTTDTLLRALRAQDALPCHPR